MQCRIDHVHLRSRDALKAGAFYVDVLGATRKGTVGAPVSRVILDLGGLTVFIENQPDLPAGSKPPHLGLEHIGLAVENVDASLTELAKHGILPVSGPTDLSDVLRIAFFNGPDDVRIELLQRGPRG